MNYWLMKSEPDVFGINDLYSKASRTEHWDGVRNYQARNMMRDAMKLGDQVFFYHSNCDQPGIVGIMEVVKEGYPDFTAFDPDDSHFDPKSDPAQPRWIMVDVRYIRTLSRNITLKELKSLPELTGMVLLRRGNRLSIMPVSEEEWQYIISLETTQPIMEIS
ncbi:EVE domain-containing protein [Methylobacter sp. S3L5C]|uniref:EVE domain-containing protein n=1 Tax=Methylobacter sp. S3L5C TaxID=2839024 RepID=UPI001FAE2621|nr:EVE domain-containing protein [Methylobacter sp. S3L5C]UOA10274.1 EVE domain-containing protein [Methylobacter sp. S3L5C]